MLIAKKGLILPNLILLSSKILELSIVYSNHICISYNAFNKITKAVICHNEKAFNMYYITYNLQRSGGICSKPPFNVKDKTHAYEYTKSVIFCHCLDVVNP